MLDESLIKQFVKATNDKTPEQSESMVYGEAKFDTQNNFLGVQFDGSNLITPCAKSVDVGNGDRVLVHIKNRQAIVIANITNPSINVGTLWAEKVVVKPDLEDADEQTIINGGVIDCDTLKVDEKIIVYAPVWDEDTQQWTGETDEFEVISFAEVNPYYSELWAFQHVDKVLFATPFTDDQGQIHYPEVEMYNLGVNTLRVGDREGTQHGLGIYYGTISGFSVPAKGYIDVVIDFPEGAFSKTHRVALTPQSAQTHADTGLISWGIFSRTLDSVTVRVFNNSSNARFMAFDWIAIGV